MWSILEPGAAPLDLGPGPDDRFYTVGAAIEPLTLPAAASGGQGELSYSLTPDVPGLVFDPATRTLGGTPAAAGRYAMTWRVHDASGDTDWRRFGIVVAGAADDASTSYAVGDTLSELPDEAWRPDAIANGSYTMSGDGVAIELDRGGYFESGGHRYTCQSATGCTVNNRELAAGSILRTALDSGPGDGGNGDGGEDPQDDLDDHGDDAASATAVAAGSDTSGALDAGDVDYFAVTVTAAGTLEVYTSGGIDTYGHLQDAGGAQVARNDDSGAGRNFRISQEVDAGVWYVRVRGYSDRVTGGYALHVRFTEADSGTPPPGGGGTGTGGNGGDTSPSFASVAGPGDRSYTVGTAITALTLPAASGGDGALTYTLTPGVPGLTFDAAGRRLSGTPSTASTYALTYTATDADGDSDSLGFTVTVKVDGGAGGLVEGFELSKDPRFNPTRFSYANGRLYIIDSSNDGIFAYAISGDRDPEADFDLASDNDDPYGIAYANERYFVLDLTRRKVFAYLASGDRDAAADFEFDDHGALSIVYADGRFYLLSQRDDKVYAYTASGERDAAADFDLASDNSRARSIAYANGRFFVLDDQFERKVYAYTASGNRAAAADFILAGDNRGSIGIAYANGHFFVADQYDYKAYAYTASGDHDVAADFLIARDNNEEPEGIAYANDRFFVVDGGDRKVYAYAASGSRDAPLDFELASENRDPSGIAYANGNFYVTDPDDRKVYAYTASGERDYAAGFDLASDIGAPQGIAYANGRFHIVDGADRKVYAYTASGSRDAAADFNLSSVNGGSTGIVYARGRFFVSDAPDSKVYAYTISGERDAVRDFALDNSNERPRGMAYAYGQFVVVDSDYSDDRVYAYTGDSFAEFSLDTENGNYSPRGIAYANARFFVVDDGDDRVYAYTAVGAHDPAADFELHEDNGNARGIVHANGRFYVTDLSDDKIYAYTATGAHDPAADFELHRTSFFSPNGIAYVDGRFFVVDTFDSNRGVYAYTASGDREPAADFRLQLSDATGITYANGRFFVVFNGDGAINKTVQAYTATGNHDPAAGFDLYAMTPNSRPRGIAHTNDRLYVIDSGVGRSIHGNQKVFAYRTSGERDPSADFDLDLDVFGHEEPSGITYADGRFFVVMDAYSTAFAYSASGERDPAADFRVLYGIGGGTGGIVYANDRLYVVDDNVAAYNDRVVAYTATGERDVAADFELNNAVFRDPTGIAFAKERFFIVDKERNRVYAYTVSGFRDTLADFDLEHGNDNPQGIVHANGRLYVVDAGSYEDAGDGYLVYSYPVPSLPGEPDLATTSATISSRQLVAGDSFNLDVEVRNGGDVAAAPTTLRYFLSTERSFTQSDAEVGTTALDGLAAGAVSRESIALRAPSTDGCYFCGACVDAVNGERFTEDNCSNAVLITVGQQTDLAVSSFVLHAPNSAVVGQTNLRATVEVTNNGELTSLPKKLHLSGGSSRRAVDVPALAPGESVTFNESVGTARAGITTYRACVDYPCDEDTGNNCDYERVTYTPSFGNAPNGQIELLQ